MAQQQVQLCIITGQALANLIPLLQEKPQHVVLMYSNDKKNNADAFVSTLLEAGFQKEQIQLEAGLPFSPFNAICEYAIELIERVRNLFPEARLTWNATGGTKQMALAVWDMLDLSTDRVIYCDTRSGVIEELSEEGGITPLASLLTPELYLHALGKVKRSAESDSVVWRERAQERKAATRHLAENAESLVGLIQTFNRQLKKMAVKCSFSLLSVLVNSIKKRWIC